MSLKDTIRAVQSDLPITVRHEKWLTNNSNPKYSADALIFAQQQLAGVTGSQRLRKQMFRASSATDCKRKQIFAFIKAPRRDEIESRLAGIFATGNFMHLKWQMAGLTEGWLVRAEVPVDKDDLNAGGTMDGVLYTGGGFEFKTINDRGYQMVLMNGPQPGHISQVHNYMYLGDIDHFSIVYENKNTAEWREFKIERDEYLIEQAKKGFEELNEHLDKKRLPKMLSDCEIGEGATYRQCPFRDICPKPSGVWE
jgi:hypothetical protein